MKNSIYNAATTYYNVNTDSGLNREKSSITAVFAVQDKEMIYETEILGYTPFEVIRSKVDEIDMAMVAENARSKYMTSLQHYQFIGLRGFNVKRQGINNRLKKLVKLHVFREYEIKKDGCERGIRYYGLGCVGLKLAQEQNVIFHMGNWVQKDVVEDPDTVKRTLAANMVILGLLRNGVDICGFGFNETIRPLQDMPITDNCILRTPGMFWIDEESVFLVEVVRSTPHAFRKLVDKVQRYYTLVNNPNYLTANAHGHTSMPQLVICAESFEDSCKIDAYLRSRGLWSEEDSLLYTYDIVFMKDTLRVFYELKEDGTPVWYSLPSRFDKETQFCA